MKSRRQHSSKPSIRHAKRQSTRSYISWSQRARRLQFGTRDSREPFSPPEDWYEPKEDGSAYRIIVQPPGEGYRHAVTPEQIRRRLESLPQRFLQGLEFVQLSRMTRKKQSFPCYGMQWGAALYLYPLEKSLEEIFYSPPRPNVLNEATMYGGRWDRPATGVWRLTWSPAAIEDFYLNNILIHELGHLVDDRNSTYTDRERYAEWFAIEYGYRPTGGRQARRQAVQRRRHHNQ